jgi:hypothetical protein
MRRYIITIVDKDTGLMVCELDHDDMDFFGAMAFGRQEAKNRGIKRAIIKPKRIR